MKTAFWTAVIVYYAIVLSRFCILPAFRRRERNRALDRGASAYKRYLMRLATKSISNRTAHRRRDRTAREKAALAKYWKFCN